VTPKAVKPKATAKKIAAIVQSKKQSDAEETGRGLSYTLGETHSKFIKIYKICEAINSSTNTFRTSSLRGISFTSRDECLDRSD
jgi:hypothetical protein